MWTLLSDHACYEGLGSAYASFTFPKNGTLIALKLQHISGLITCSINNPSFGSSKWTCNDDITKLSTVITDINKNIIFPPNVTLHRYVSGVKFADPTAYQMSPNELLYRRPKVAVSKGTSFQIWNTNDLGGDVHDLDNAGRHCVKVFGKYDF